MPYAANSVALVANVESANQLSGNIEEFITRPSFCRLSAVTSVAPATCKFFIGRTVLVNSQNINGIGATISLKDHVVTEHLGVRGRIVLTFTSTGTPTVLWRLDIVPLQ